MEKLTNTKFKEFISGYSIEVVPNSAAKIESFSDILPIGTRVYIAHLEKEDIATATIMQQLKSCSLLLLVVWHHTHLKICLTIQSNIYEA